MTSLQEEVIPTCNWKRYVDGTHTYVNPEKVEFIFTKFNSWQPNIKFTFKLKMNKQIIFLDVLVQRTAADQIETCVHRKKASTNLYINWNADAPLEWKMGTLTNPFKRAKIVRSTTILLQQAVKHFKKSIYWNK